MDYCRLYASMRDDPKMLALPDRAFRRHIETMCWVTQHETDGRVPKGLVAESVARRLVGAGLWEIFGDGYLIHNWTGRQRTKDEMDATRMARAKAGAKGAAKRWHGKSDGKPIAELEVEEELETELDLASLREAPKANTADQMPELLLEASSRAVMLLEKLRNRDEKWDDVSPGAVMKLGRKYGAAVLLEALADCTLSTATVLKAYPYLEDRCQRIARERAS